MARFTNFEPDTIVGSTIADRPPAGAPGLQGGTIFKDLATGNAWLYVTNPGGNTWVPLVGLQNIPIGVPYKFNGGAALEDANALTRDIADDVDIGETVWGPVLYPAFGDFNRILGIVLINTNTLSVPSTLVVMRSGVDVVTIPIAPGETGQKNIAQLATIVAGNSIQLQIRVTAGGVAGQFIQIGSVIYLTNTAP